jgi:hypothetical protein
LESRETKCRHCGKPVGHTNEQIRISSYPLSDIAPPPCFIFHKECFIEIAGTEYIPSVQPKHTIDDDIKKIKSYINSSLNKSFIGKPITTQVVNAVQNQANHFLKQIGVETKYKIVAKQDPFNPSIVQMDIMVIGT